MCVRVCVCVRACVEKEREERVYAVAYAVDIALGLDPVQVKYDQKLMRGHLRRCLSTGQFDRFPCEKRVCRAARPDTFTLTL